MIKKGVNLTTAGKAELEKELASLIAQRPAIAERLATARSFGDLSENQEYSDARSEQKTVENRILEIENILKNANIIKGGKKSKVALGARVEIEINGKSAIYEIVDPVEADPLSGKISQVSPIGKQLIGLKVGESTEFNGRTYKIVSISWPLSVVPVV